MSTNKLSTYLSCVRSSIIVVLLSILVSGCANQQVAQIQVPDLPPPVTKPIKNVHVALVLSSGGFRGLAHIGALEVLEENKIPIDLIVGSSAGSFIGAFYADEPNALLLKSKLINARYETLIDNSWIRAAQMPFRIVGPVKGQALQQFMLRNMRARDFSELKIPLIVVTTSIINNQMETIQTGPIIPAVHASSALPPYFAPVNVYENSYVDGGVIAPVPVAVARQFHPQLVIAIDITQKPSLSEMDNALQIAGRAIDIKFFELAKGQASTADIVIRPDIIGYGAFEDDYNEELYIAGRRAALARIDEIKAALLKIQNKTP